MQTCKLADRQTDKLNDKHLERRTIILTDN